MHSCGSLGRAFRGPVDAFLDFLSFSAVDQSHLTPVCLSRMKLKELWWSTSTMTMWPAAIRLNCLMLQVNYCCDHDICCQTLTFIFLFSKLSSVHSLNSQVCCFHYRSFRPYKESGRGRHHRLWWRLWWRSQVGSLINSLKCEDIGTPWRDAPKFFLLTALWETLSSPVKLLSWVFFRDSSKEIRTNDMFLCY